MGIPTSQEALWGVAKECAISRRLGKCTAEFASSVCVDCRWYVGRYIDADPRQVELFMIQAENSAADLVDANKKAITIIWKIVIGLVLLIALGIFLLAYKTPHQRQIIAERERQKQQQTVQVQQPARAQQTPVARTNATQAIDATLTYVARDLRNKTDVNADGLVNCIDAAVLFYKYYPVRSEVTITLNVNEATGMNHLFNVVLVNGTWRAVEPQANFTNQSSYWMKDVWGAKYDSSKNTNATRDYVRYVR